MGDHENESLCNVKKCFNTICIIESALVHCSKTFHPFLSCVNHNRAQPGMRRRSVQSLSYETYIALLNPLISARLFRFLESSFTYHTLNSLVVSEVSPVSLVPVVGVCRARHLTALLLTIHFLGASPAPVAWGDQHVSPPRGPASSAGDGALRPL